MLLALSRQLLLFLVVGIVQILFDWSLFVLFTHLGVAVVAANMGSRVIAASLGYWLNGRHTFAGPDGRSRLGPVQLRRYIIGWLSIAALSTLLVSLVASHSSLQMAWLAKPLVEAFLAPIGFVVWRQWVFR